MSEDQAKAKRRTRKGLAIGIPIALVVIWIFATPNPTRILRTNLECDLSSWDFGHGHYGEVGGSGISTNYEYWEVGPLLISQPEK